MDFHSMIGKLRAIESLGNKQEYVAEDAPDSAIAGKCNMTAEGKSCPVHGMEECWSAPMEESDAAALASMLKNSGQITEAPVAVPGYTDADVQEWMRANNLTDADIAGLSTDDIANSLQLWKLPGAGHDQLPGQRAELGFNVQSDRAGPQTALPGTTPPVAPGGARPGGPAAGMPAAKRQATGTYTAPYDVNTPAAGGARPEAPAASMPAATEPATFKDAFRAARKAAGGAGGVFMWKGKPYQTNVKGEPAKAWNSPDLKKVGSGWPTSESVGRRMKTTRVNEAGGIGGGISGGKFGMPTAPKTAAPAPQIPGYLSDPDKWEKDPTVHTWNGIAGTDDIVQRYRPKAQPGGARPAGPAAGMPAAPKTWRDSEFQPGGARPPGPYSGMPAAPSTGMTGRGLPTNIPRTDGKSATITPPAAKRQATGTYTAPYDTKPGGARPAGPAAGMPAASLAPTTSPRPQPRPADAGTNAAPATFKDAFRAARKAAGGGGGVFMWKGKPYQTNVKGEPAKAWNSPDLKKVGSGWPTSESAGMRKKKVDEQISTPADTGYRKAMSGAFAAMQPRDRYMLPTGLTGSAAKPSYGPGTVAPGSMPAAKTSYGPGTVAPGSMPASGATVSSGQAAAAERMAGNNAALATKNAGMMGRGLPSTIARTGNATASISSKTSMPPVPGTLGTLRGGDARMGAASTGKLPGAPAAIGKPTGLSVEYNDEEWYQFTGADGRTRYVGSDSGLADKATRARLRAIMKPDPVQFNKNNSEEAQLAINQMANNAMGMSEAVNRMRKLSGISEMVDYTGDQSKVDDMAADLSADAVDEMTNYDQDTDDMTAGMTIDDLMHKYGVDYDDEVNEDAPLVGMPFTSLGATNNGPEEWGMVVTGGTSTNNFNESKKLKEGFTINSNMDVNNGKVTKSLTINATDDDVNTLATMLRNAGMGSHVDVHSHSDVCDDCGMPEDHCTCGMNQTAMCDGCNRPLDHCTCGDESDDCGCGSESCTCGMTLENADHDYGHDEKSEMGEPLDVEDYVWDGPHLNQRFGKIGDNTLMAERAITLFKNYSDQYTQMLEEADLDPSNAGFDSPLTANSRDEFDKDPFVDETPVDDGSRSPLSTVKRQDVMEQIRKLAKILEATHALYRIKVLAEAATKDDAVMLTRIIENFQSKTGVKITGVLDKNTMMQLESVLSEDAPTVYDTPHPSAAQQAHDALYANQMANPESMGWKVAEPDTDSSGNLEMPTFPSMGVANSKLDFYQPGEEAMIAGQAYIRDVDAQNNDVWRLKNASDAPSEY